MTLTRALNAFDALRARLDRSPTDRLIFAYPEWQAFVKALSEAPALVNADRARLQETLPKRGLEIV